MMVKEFREQTRQLECHLDNMNKTSCCCGVSTSQCFLIVEIGRKPGISVKELSNILHIDKSSVSRAVEDLVQNGLVERMPSKEDRRYVVLNLSPKGQKRFEKIENDYFVSSSHEMTKEHYISFVAMVTGDAVMMRKQYPEWNLQVRIPAFGRGRLVWYCTQHGLFYQDIKVS